jgi:uncharacterized protein YceK
MRLFCLAYQNAERRKAEMKKVIVLLAVLTVILSGCDFASRNLNQAIEYRVTGSTSTADLTFENSGGGTSQQSGVTVPWSYTFTANPGDFLYISAQKDGNPATDVTVTIYAEGSVFGTSTSSGAYVIATAHGIL